MNPKRIPLSQGKYALVDIEDFQELNKWKWHVGNRGYAVRHLKDSNRIKIFMHRVIIDAPIGKEVDHINQDRLDNRKDNLRVCTRQENLMNQKMSKINTSGYKGVSYYKKDNRYESRIGFNNKVIYLGRFHTGQDAAIAYNVAAKNYYGEFARLNQV